MNTYTGKFADTKFNDRHPFKMGVRQLLEHHFSPSIASRFDFILELEKYILDPQRTHNLIRQKQDQNFMMEVYYFPPDGFATYICDLGSWWPKEQCEHTLLQYITDKYKTGSIGKDWSEHNGTISTVVSSGKLLTKDPGDIAAFKNLTERRNKKK